MKNFYSMIKVCSSTIFICAFYSTLAQDKNSPIENFQSPFNSKAETTKPMSIARQSSNLSDLKISLLEGSFHQGIKELSISRAQIEENLTGYLGLSKSHKFSKISERIDEKGFTHISYQQFFKGIPIDGSIALAHYKNGKAEVLNGNVVVIDKMDVIPAISENRAVEIAKNYLNIQTVLNTYPNELVIARVNSDTTQRIAFKVRIESISPFNFAYVYVDAKLGVVMNVLSMVNDTDTAGSANTLYSGVQSIINDSFSGGLRLHDNGRKIETYNATNATFGTNTFENYSEFVNPSTSWGVASRLTSVTISTIAQNWWYSAFADETPDLYIKIKDGSNQVVYKSGYFNNVNPPVLFNLDIQLLNPPYVIEVWDYDVIDADDFGGSYPVSLSAGNQTFSGSGNTGSYAIDSRSNPALDVHWGMEKTFDFYQNVFGRNSFDGLGSPIKNFVNGVQQLQGDQNNSFALNAPYNIMVYGMGDGILFKPLVSLDVEGHEYSHLVISNNGNGGLAYQNESGALNESFADIFGTCVEFNTLGAGANWNIGESIMVSLPYLRSMSNPNSGFQPQPDTYKGTYWENSDCGTPSDRNDKCGVHTNSGVQNFWFYLLSVGGSGTNDLSKSYSVPGIGINQARQIAYRNLTTYLTPSATYLDAYNGSLQSAQDLFGNPSSQYSAVRAAWYAVGIGNDPNNYCSGTTNLTASTGVISDGSGSANYLNNAACKWVIAPPGATHVSLNFTAFNTEANNDIVYAYDGPDDTYPLLLTWWGNTLPSTVTSSGGAICIKFISNGSVTANGWSTNYTSSGISPSCSGGTVLSTPTGTFTDGSGSGSYGNNQLCYWLIAPPCATGVSLSLTQLNTELNYDGVVVYDGPSISSPVLGVFSGTTLPSSVTATTGQMLVVFISDYSSTLGGFSANYTSTGSATCSGVTALTTSDYGAITDGSGSNNYCNNLDCQWLIQPPQATNVTLNFTAFDLESPSTDGKTIYDAVEIYDGTTTAAPLLGRFSGNSLPPSLTSTSGSVLIRFYSDAGEAKQGWSANYTSKTATYCSGPSNLTTLTGSLTDGSGANQYGNNTQCSWLIKPANVKNITLTFTAFETELNADGVIIYDGESNTSAVLGKFSGTSIPTPVTSTGGSMYVEFISNSSMRAAGWNATYSSAVVVGLENTFTDQIITVYPNPTNGAFYIKSLDEEQIELEIIDSKGKSVNRIQINKGESRIDATEFAKGLYVLQFQTKAGCKVKKIIIQ